MEENGTNKTTMFTPADLHDHQNGDDSLEQGGGGGKQTHRVPCGFQELIERLENSLIVIDYRNDEVPRVIGHAWPTLFQISRTRRQDHVYRNAQ
jgi:hypothetical protein